MKVTTKYERHKAVITDLSTGKKTNYQFINAAKRESRKLQAGQLGQGLVQVKR